MGSVIFVGLFRFVLQDHVRLLQEAWNAIEKGDLSSAQRILGGLLKENPKHPDAHAGMGVIFLRQGDYAKALATFKHARHLGSRYAHLDLEEARVHYFLRDFKAAVALLERFKTSHAEMWKADEILGLCYFYTERYEASIQAFARAYAVNPTNRYVYAYHMGMALGALGRFDEAEARLKETVRLSSDTLYGISAKEWLAKPRPKPPPPTNPFRTKPPPKNWSVKGILEGEWDTNPMSLGEVIGPTTLKQEELWKLNSTVEGTVEPWIGNHTQFLFKGSYAATFYDRIAPLDTDSGAASASVRHWFSEWVSLGVGGGALKFYQGGDYILFSGSGYGYLTWAQSSYTQSLLSYSYGNTKYFLDTLPRFLDPDSRTHSVSLRQDWLIPNTRLLLAGGYSLTESIADGDDYDATFHTFTLSQSHPLFWEIHESTDVSYTAGNYHHRSSRSTPAFSNVRDDDLWKFGLRLQRKFGEYVTIHLEGSWGMYRSSVPLYDYSRDIYTLGVTLSY